jgi:hypothetical protein
VVTFVAVASTIWRSASRAHALLALVPFAALAAIALIAAVVLDSHDGRMGLLVLGTLLITAGLARTGWWVWGLGGRSVAVDDDGLVLTRWPRAPIRASWPDVVTIRLRPSSGRLVTSRFPAFPTIQLDFADRRRRSQKLAVLAVRSAEFEGLIEMLRVAASEHRVRVTAP